MKKTHVYMHFTLLFHIALALVEIIPVAPFINPLWPSDALWRRQHVV